MLLGVGCRVDGRAGEHLGDQLPGAALELLVRVLRAASIARADSIRRVVGIGGERQGLGRELLERAVDPAAARRADDRRRATVVVHERHRAGRHRLDHGDAEVLEAVGVVREVLAVARRRARTGRRRRTARRRPRRGALMWNRTGRPTAALRASSAYAAVDVLAPADEVQLPVPQARARTRAGRRGRARPASSSAPTRSGRTGPPPG